MGFTRVNAVYGTVGTQSNSGSTSVVLGTGQGAAFGSASVANPIRCAVIDTSTSPETLKFFLDVTGVSTDTLTVANRGVTDGNVSSADANILVGYTIAAVASVGVLDGSYAALATWTTKGDVLVASGAATPVRQGVGADGTVFIADSTQTAGVKWGTPGSPLFGDGSDGTVTVSGATTITRDMYYDTLTVANGGTLTQAGFRVFVRGLCTVASGGAIRCDGAAGSVASGGGQYGNSFVTLGRNGAGATGGSGAGGAGGNNGTGVYLSGTGGTGGTGSGGAGGAGGSQSNPSFWGSSQAPRNAAEASRAMLYFNGNHYLLQGGTGGGAGGGDGGNSGGGSGAGGGVLVLAAGRISNSGTISASGGNGGAKTTGNCGGGGGGGGGTVLAVTNSYTGTAPVANGGIGGAGTGTGTSGSNGAAGTVITVSPS